MVKEEVPKIISQGESFTVEFKGEEKSPLSDYELYKAVVCLADGNGGLLLIGLCVLPAVYMSAVPLWERANLDFCKWVVEQERAGRTLSLDALFILNELQYERRINISRAVELTQKTEGDVRSTLENLVEYGIIEAKGEKRGRTYHLAANVYRTFGEKAGYVRTRGFEPIQQQEMVIQYLRAHKYIKRSEVTELCKISPDQAKRLLRKLVKAGKLLQHGKGKGTRYELDSLNTGEPK